MELGVEEPVAGSNADTFYLYGYSSGEYGSGSVAASPAAVEFKGSLVKPEETLYKLGGDQVLYGYSGCPALNLRSGVVCAVVDSTRDPRNDLGGFGRPIAAVTEALPGVLERNESEIRRSDTWKRAVEMERSAEIRRSDASALPLLPPLIDLEWNESSAESQLLKPRFGVVKLQGREGLQTHLMRWRESEDRLKVLLLTGAGGFGKTRLAAEECERARKAGWTAGLLAVDQGESVDSALRRLTTWPERLFVAIDYAETRPALVASLLLRLSRRMDGPPVRVVLICRQVQSREDLEELFAVGDGHEEISRELARAEPVRLDQHSLDSRGLFEVGHEAFASLLGAEPTAAPRPSLNEDHFERPLFVLAAALLTAKDPSVKIDSMSQNGLMIELLQHERRYWDRLNNDLAVGLDKALQSRAVATATVLGAETEQEALKVAAVVLGEGSSTERHREVARWLSHLYSDGRLDSSPAIAPVEPDMLAEALVANEYERDQEFLEATLEAASEIQMARALGVLTKASVGNGQLRERFRNALEKWLPRIAAQRPAASAEVLGALDLAVSSVEPVGGALVTLLRVSLDRPTLARLRATVARVVVDYGRQQIKLNPQARNPLALALNELALALSDRGNVEEALQVSREAVELRRQLAEEDPDEHREALAGTLNNLSNRLDELGRPEALDAIEECLEIRRQISASSDEGRAEIAGGLNNLAGVLGNQGRREEALKAIEEAAFHYRVLAERQPERYLPDLGMALNNVAIVLSDLGRSQEGLPAAEEAVRHYRQLVASEPEQHLPGLAIALSNLSTLLPDMGRHEEALEVIEEAVRHRRALAMRDPEANLDDLAGALNNLSNRLDRLGRRQEALTPVKEASEAYRLLAKQNPDRWLPDLAMALTNLANRLSQVGALQDALRQVSDSVAAYRLLAEQNPDRYQPSLAMALTNMSGVMAELRRLPEALRAGEEAVQVQRNLRGNDKVTASGLAIALSNFSVVLHLCGRGDEALAAAREAVSLYRSLAAETPSKYHPELAGALINLSNRLFDHGEYDDALEVIEEAVGHFRTLTAQNPGRHLPDLTLSLNSMVGLLSKTDRSEEAWEVAIEAVEHSRATAKSNPDRHRTDLAGSLHNLVLVGGDIGRAEEARALVEEARAEHGDSNALLLLVLAGWHSQQKQLDQALRLAAEGLGHAATEPSGSVEYEIRSFLFHLRNGDEADFDERWQRELGEPLPLWLKHYQVDEELIDLLGEWVGLGLQDSWWEFLESHPELLTDRSEALLDNLAHKARVPQLLFSLGVLRAVRQEGLPAARRQVEEELSASRRRQRLREWLEVDSPKLFEFLDEHWDELLDPHCEKELSAALSSAPEKKPLLVRLGLMSLAKNLGANYKSVAGGPFDEPVSDAECATLGESEVLGITRLRAAAREDDSEAQFQHAVAAAVAGFADESRQALDRCRDLTPSWDRADFQRRLGGLVETHPHLEDEIGTLAGRFSGSSSSALET